MPEQKERTPKVSIIMRSKNSEWIIGHALSALYSQNFKDFELLVVDSGSTDRTLDIVKKYPHRLIEIEAISYYPGAVLNMAIEQARGEIIVFQNSDGVPLCEDTLGRLVEAFDDSEVQAAVSRQLPRPDAHAWVKRDYAVSFPDSDELPSWIGLSLPLAAMRKDIWKEHEFYTDAWASEDTEWGEWAKRNGHKIKYVKDAIIMHSHNYTLKEMYGRRFVEGEADVFIYGGEVSFFDMLKKYAVSSLKDALFFIKTLEISEIFFIPIKRLVYHWAYYKGHMLGEVRKKSGNKDTSSGQSVVLASQKKSK